MSEIEPRNPRARMENAGEGRDPDSKGSWVKDTLATLVFDHVLSVGGNIAEAAEVLHRLKYTSGNEGVITVQALGAWLAKNMKSKDRSPEAIRAFLATRLTKMDTEAIARLRTKAADTVEAQFETMYRRGGKTAKQARNERFQKEKSAREAIWLNSPIAVATTHILLSSGKGYEEISRVLMAGNFLAGNGASLIPKSVQKWINLTFKNKDTRAEDARAFIKKRGEELGVTDEVREEAKRRIERFYAVRKEEAVRKEGLPYDEFAHIIFSGRPEFSPSVRASLFGQYSHTVGVGVFRMPLKGNVLGIRIYALHIGGTDEEKVGQRRGIRRVLASLEEYAKQGEVSDTLPDGDDSERAVYVEVLPIPATRRFNDTKPRKGGNEPLFAKYFLRPQSKG